MHVRQFLTKVCVNVWVCVYSSFSFYIFTQNIHIHIPSQIYSVLTGNSNDYIYQWPANDICVCVVGGGGGINSQYTHPI